MAKSQEIGTYFLKNSKRGILIFLKNYLYTWVWVLSSQWHLPDQCKYEYPRSLLCDRLYFDLLYSLLQVEANNTDGTSEGIVYRIQTGSNNALDYFRIDINTGDIYVIDGNIDAEIVNEFTLFVEATDTRLEPQR